MVRDNYGEENIRCYCLMIKGLHWGIYRYSYYGDN